jgi:GT2 family glycosyltransferase
VTDSDRTTSSAMLIIVPAGQDAGIAPDWLDALRGLWPGEIVAGEGARPPAGLEILPGSRGAWWDWLGEIDPGRAENGVVVLAEGLALPEHFAARLEHALAASDCPPLLTLPGNHQDGLDPAGGLVDRAGATIDTIVQAAAELRFSPVRLQPERLAVIPPGRIEDAVEHARAGQCWVYDAAWVGDPTADGDRSPDVPDLRAATGHLRAALEQLTEDDATRLPLFGFDGRPIVLHISHDWGGGVARWIDDIVTADEASNHLVLSAAGRTDGKIHGQRLRLYAAGAGRACVREWTVSPAIAGTDVEHEHYREILDGVIRRFGVARIVVSSLIGHSLDALATGLPTIEILHDYYPAWPVLDHDPMTFAGEDGRVDLDRAIAESGDGFLFAERRGRTWHQLAAAWLDAVRKHEVALAAPTEQVLERWRLLVDDALEHASVIPHGFAGWPAGTPPVEPRPLPDGRLNLVVVGRLSPGKGLRLLDDALDGLQRHARITLLGCGHHGMRFFGRPGVDIVIDYRHAELPRHLSRIGAQAVLFLSTVAETWNYVLTETRTLGLVPLATRTGSFLERVRADVDGVLFDPDPDALVSAVKALYDEPGRLDALRTALPDEPTVGVVLSRIDSLAGLRSAEAARAAAGTNSDLQSSATWGLLADARSQHRRFDEQIKALEYDLARRTDWARKHERLAAERTNWARELEAQVQTGNRRIDSLESELTTARSDANAERARADHLDQELQSIFASRSWRVTRPLRVVNRIADNARRRRVFNPLRWPFLLKRLVLHLRLHGARTTIELMQQGAYRRDEAPTGFTAVEPPAETLQPVALEEADSPVASIVVPVFNEVHYTSACLNSVLEHAGRADFEIIVVDDCSDDETPAYLSDCKGVRVIRNAVNSGFIASCNAGAEAARGEYLVFLNNDTTVTGGWLDALIETFETFPDTGIVGARLVYPDGRLQEAGGIVFKDASGWNYGRGDQPDRPEYNFASEADYVSGACLALRREVFAELGGFDSHYAPAYYEDTDLCFRIREIGLRVVYQPACTIVHHEGVSSGTDESSGAKRYQGINRKKFHKRWRDQLKRQPDPISGPDSVHEVRHHRHRGHVLVIDATTPEPDKDSGSMRMVAMLTILRDLGFRVSFIPENLAWSGRYTRELQALGIEVLHHPWVNDIEEWLAIHGTGLDCVIVSRHYVLAPLMTVLRRQCPRATLVFDTVDLHFLREERMAAVSDTDSARRSARKTREAELAMIERTDATLVVSPVEKQLLDKLLPDADVRVLSNIHRVHGRKRGWAERRDLMFVGGFQHPPNLDAAEWLIDEIMPRVRRDIPDARLHIIGSRMPESLRERRCEGVVMHGYVEDLGPYLEGCRLSVAPLRYGAGVKGKVNQAMAWGLPVVATACAAEGMYLADGEDVLVADTTEAFAAAIVRAYNDEALWTKLSDGGLANVEQHFSYDAARRAIVELMGVADSQDP